MTNVKEAVAAKSELAKAASPGQAMAEAVAEGKVKATAILRAVGIDPTNVHHQAALLVAQRYDLDPLMGHVLVLPNGNKPYISRDGYLHIAHRSGDLDGIEVVDEWETDTHYFAKVTVWRKSMSRGFTFRGKCGKKEHKDPESMALTRAERRALKRAFNIADDPADADLVDVDPPADAEPEVEVIHATVVDADDTPELLPAGEE